MEQTDIIGAETTRLTKKCPKCGQFLNMETSYIAAEYIHDKNGLISSAKYRPSYSVRCPNCDFESPNYDTPRELFETWDTQPDKYIVN